MAWLLLPVRLYLMKETTDRRIAELRSACGCKEGVIGFVIGAAGYGLALQYFPIAWQAHHEADPHLPDA